MKNYNEKDIICTADMGITVILDEDHARTLSNQYRQGCIAIKDANMGYGVFFTKDGTSGVYGPKGVRVLLDNYWESNANQIDRALNEAWDANDVNALVEVGAEIIVSCSAKLIEAFEEFKQSVGA